METCHGFFAFGILVLLRQTVWLQRQVAFESFCGFLFATSPEPSNRPVLLHDLRIRDYLVENNKSMILRIISSATHLRSLDIFLPKAAPEFRNVLAGYTNLRELEVRLECSKTAADSTWWFGQIQSPIETLSISFNSVSSQGGIISSISPLAGTLKSLTLIRARIDPTDADFEFPHVRHFRLDQSVLPVGYFPPSAATIFKLFPNLESLTLPRTEKIFIDLPFEYSDRVQEATDFGVHRRHLKRLEGCLTELSLGGYNCSVDELYLCIGSHWPWHGERASFLLSQARPSIFHMKFHDDAPTLNAIRIIHSVPSLGPFKQLLINFSVTMPDDPVTLEITVSFLDSHSFRHSYKFL